MGTITYNGVSTDSLGIRVWTFPAYEYPEKDVTAVHIPGRNGDVLIDTGAYKNVTRTYSISIAQIKRNMSYRDMAHTISSWLHSADGYARLEDSYEPGIFRLAAYSEQNNVENILNEAGTASISFNCKPQRYLVEGEQVLTINSSGAYIKNKTSYESLPLIKITMSGASSTLSIGAYEVQIVNLSAGSVLYVDSELKDSYLYSGNNIQNGNNKTIMPSGFPRLVPGNNRINWTSGISKIEVTPRWWTI